MGTFGDRRLSFDRVADVYDGIRPSYPSAMFDALFQLLPSDRSPDIVEVGPGTGQATKDLLARGARVHAVEIGPAMAAGLQTNLATDHLQVTVGDFELLRLQPDSADAVFSATAYHWISRESQTNRPAYILRTGGIVAIVDLVQVDSPEDNGFFEASQPIYERYGQGHTGPPAPTRSEVAPPMSHALTADPRYGSVEVRCFDWDQTYTAAEYRQLMISYSTTQMMNDADRLGLLDDIEGFVNREFGGSVTRPVVVALTSAVLLGPDAV